MKAKTRKKHLDISNLGITRYQLDKLIEIESSLAWAINHDLNNPLTTIRGFSELLLEDITDLLDAMPKKKKLTVPRQDLAQVKNYIEMISTQTFHARKILDGLLGYANKGDSPSQILISKPYYIAQRIQEIYPKCNIQISQNSWKSLEIIYPENILFGIIHEIIHNAIKICGDDCEVLIAWKILNSNFQLEIHDNGIGIIPELGESFIASSDLIEMVSPRGRDSGLRIISRIGYWSGGNILFKRSSVLGGTFVLFELPIYGYYKKGVIYDLSKE